MKKILVLSDLHIPSRMQKFPRREIEPYMKDIDIIFGLGDYDSQEGLENLYEFDKELHLIWGNMDSDDIKNRLPQKITLNIEGFNVGLIHGWGGPWDIREKIFKQFDNNIDLICYGHTHSSFFGKKNNIYFFNPGSVCGGNPSFGMVTIDSKIDAQVISLKK